MNTWIGIQARSGSTRLPNKSLAYVTYDTLIKQVYHRCKEACEQVVVLIPEGDPLNAYLHKNGIQFFEGSESNLLERYVKAFEEYKMDRVVRITADCPFIDPSAITHSLYLMDRYGADFVSNCMETCVDGMEVEVMNRKAIVWLDCESEDLEDFEHVTMAIKNVLPTDELKIYSWQSPIPVKYVPKMSIDTMKDLLYCQEINTKLNRGIL